MMTCLYSGNKDVFLQSVRSKLEEFLAENWEPYQVKQVFLNGEGVFEGEQEMKAQGTGVRIEFGETGGEQITATVRVENKA